MEEAEHVPPGGRGEAPRPCGWSLANKTNKQRKVSVCQTRANGAVPLLMVTEVSVRKNVSMNIRRQELKKAISTAWQIKQKAALL
jgi:hypothetical protein